MKAATKAFFRALVEIRGRRELLHLAVIEDRNAVRHGQCLGLVVGHIDHGHTELLVNVLDLVLHLLTQILVQRTEWFVHQDELRLEDQRPGHRDALLLAAGELGRHARAEIRELDHVEGTLYPCLDIRLAHLANPQREGEVFRHRHVRE